MLIVQPMSIFFSYNDKFYPEGTPVVTPDSRAIRYGDGLFESVKIINGKIIHAELHFQRLIKGLSLLEFDIPKFFSFQKFESDILYLAQKNGHLSSARVRYAVLRGNGGLYDAENHHPNIIIQTWALAAPSHLNENGLVMGVYHRTHKPCDELSNLKNNNYLPNVLAALYAQKNKFNDVVLLNVHNRVCESTIANLFIVKGEKVFTPSLAEGCVAGVYRQHVIDTLQKNGVDCIETAITVEELYNADEAFVTNSVANIKWIKQIDDTAYGSAFIVKIYSLF